MIEGAVDVSVLLRCGVYLLLHRKRVVYVGQTREGLTRLYTHRNLARRRKALPKHFPASVRGVVYDEAFFVPCAPEVMDDLERRLIDCYRPQYNVQLKPPDSTSISAPVTLNVAGVPLVLNQAPKERLRRRA